MSSCKIALWRNGFLAYNFIVCVCVDEQLVSDEPPSVSPLSVDVASQWSSGSVVGSSSSQLLHQQQQHQPQMLDDHSATAHTSLFTTLSDSFNAYAKSASGLLG